MAFLKEAATAILAHGGGNWVWKALTRAGRRPVVVVYHRVLARGERPLDRTQRYVTAAEFTRQVTYLSRTRRATTLAELVADADGAGPAFAVTFDDGYGDTYRVAFPTLRELGVTATAFVTTEVVSGGAWQWWDRLAHALSESVGETFRAGGRIYYLANEKAVDSAQAALTAALKRSPRREAIVEDIATQLGVAAGVPEGLYMSWEEVRTLHRCGWTIGAHSQTHRIYTTMTGEETRADVEGCAARIEREIGERPRLVAPPNGEYDDEAVAIFRRAGFTGAVTMVGGPIRPKAGPFRIARVAPNGGEPWALFMLRLSGLYDMVRRL
ncbi:MAG: polysaccharide deacetylase family protein [candidate division Zixibacteria bacterium]|nr:polysaccharide deacetylase family protein [candidate division Zixibacteria bacterium]